MRQSDNEDQELNWRELSVLLASKIEVLRIANMQEMMNQVEKEKHREIFCKFADQVSFLMIENLPRKESARLLINAIELYQHRHPINNALIPGK
jgi:hypothetical protein